MIWNSLFAIKQLIIVWHNKQYYFLAFIFWKVFIYDSQILHVVSQAVIYLQGLFIQLVLSSLLLWILIIKNEKACLKTSLKK